MRSQPLKIFSSYLLKFSVKGLSLKDNLGSRYLRFSSSVCANKEELRTSTEKQNPKARRLTPREAFECLEGKSDYDKRKFEYLMYEIDDLKSSGISVPRFMSVAFVKDLLSAKTSRDRCEMLEYAYNREVELDHVAMFKEFKKKEKSYLTSNTHSKHQEDSCSPIVGYMQDRYMRDVESIKLITAMQFNQHIVIDCSFDPYMDRHEATLCAIQMRTLYSLNRMHIRPYNVQFCSVDKNSLTFRALHTRLSRMYQDSFLINLSEKSYLDLYPKEKLVYITHFSTNDLTEYNCDDVYILPGYGDISREEQIPLIKAKQQNIRHARLPIHKYKLLRLRRSPNLQKAFKIMLDMNYYKDWSTALKKSDRLFKSLHEKD